ncbi:MAG: undecaprenyldiphospho-muramoylpentapeptide beta-N-acetylglucosaminyltransferase [Gammaproteobacteria bacterium]|jgi:UDP-N-acetylglucosamine--N-acetylmuramyl-(pentapeptide) pyrophosphoryl-undecaprenol N-acetylglucosamine transferase|nr:undecaprenyldiphospho-muramoylpentapeptide beta-N-acetylglucosaminyltransferase [Gammaproteobacteria bacterium]
MVMRVLIMAGGTGGHIFPALAVAERLRAEGAEVLWLGARGGLETRLVPRAGFALETVRIRGLRGKGVVGWITLPFRLLLAMFESLVVIMRFRPLAVLGMGGFVTGPGGLTTWLLRKPLVVHEQNAIAGMTNRWLSRLATRSLVAFPDALPRAELTGNPVRESIERLPAPEARFADRSGPLRLLVLGGSQGARSLNEALPRALAGFARDRRALVHHQTGRELAGEVARAYENAGIEARVEEFIEDMAVAYAWADLVICRAGALTLAELAAAGLGAILVPYPWAVDDHQRRNGEFLVAAGAARLLVEGPALATELERTLEELGDAGRERLLAMARSARGLALPDAAGRVASICMEVGRA